MEYNFDLFTTVKEISSLTKYRYILKGAFYDVYTDGHNDYHMAKECEASLKERVWFYQNKINNNPYPIVSQNRDPSIDNHPNSYVVMFQVLGLPEELLFSKDPITHGVKILSAEEVFSRISFENGLFFGYGVENKISSDIIDTSDYCVIGLVNYWIENGVYFPNPERLYQTEGVDFSYPAFLDERKIPSKWKEEKITPERLFIDYVQVPLLVDKKVYQEEFQSLAEKSMSELFDIAFNLHEYSKESVLALQNYFTGLLKALANEFFKKEYHQDYVFPYSAMTEEFGFERQNLSYLAVGSRFNMPCNDYRVFTKTNEGIKESFKKGTYQIFKDDLPAIKQAYIHVIKFCRKHPNFAYMPFFIIRLIGLPYPAFEIAKYFDFEYGTFEQFISLFEIANKKSDKECQLFLMKDNDGTVLLLKDDDEKQQSMIFLLCQMNKGIFISDFDWITDFPESDALLYYHPTSKNLALLEAGDARTCLEALDDIQNEVYDDQTKSNPFSLLKVYFSKEESEGCLPSVKKFFELVNSGYMILEAGRMVISNSRGISASYFTSCISLMIKFVLTKNLPSFIQKRSTTYDKDLFEFGKDGEKFTDEYLPYPQVYKGRYFLFYSDGKDIYCDLSDRTAFMNLIAIIRNTAREAGYIPYVFSCLGKETYHRTEAPRVHDLVLPEFLGIPAELIRKNETFTDVWVRIKFVANIGITSREDHRHVLENDPTLHDYLIISNALNKGILLLGKSDIPRPVFPIRKILDEKLTYILSPVFIKNYIQNNFFIKIPINDKVGERYKFASAMDNSYHDFLLRVMDGEELQPKEIEPEKFDDDGITMGDLVLSYSGKFLSALYQWIENEVYHTNNLVSLLSVPMDGVFVSYGQTFVAYSETDNVDDFYLDIEDRELLMQSIELIRSIVIDAKGKKMAAKVMTAALGLPPVMIKRCYSLFLSEKFDEASIDITFRFKKKPDNIDAMKYTATQSDFFYQKTKDDDPINNTWVHHEALKQGYFIGTNEIFPLPIENISFDDAYDTYKKIQAMTVHVLPELKGETKMNFQPSLTGYTSQVDAYIRKLRQFGHAESYLYLLKETLYNLYRKNPNFISWSINLMHSRNVFNYQLVIQREAGFMQWKIEGKSESDDNWLLTVGVAFFIFYIEKQNVFDISQQIIKKIKRD